MASAVEHHSPVHSPVHSPPGNHPQRPKGILKKSFQRSPPTSPSQAKSGKEITIENTNINAGHRRSSSGARPPGSRRQSGHSSVHDDNGEPAQRLKWDEANLYLTEQERSPKMKIDEPKTPYAKHYDPAEDPSDGEEENPMEHAGVYRQSSRPGREDDIPGLSLGEPEEAVPEGDASAKGEKTVHVEAESSVGHHDAEAELAGMSPEEREKHRKFEQLRKKHYEMRNVAQLLGHPEDLPEDEDDEMDDGVPPLPRGVPNGSA